MFNDAADTTSNCNREKLFPLYELDYMYIYLFITKINIKKR